MTGKPVVFIHGLWLDATSWEPWLEAITKGAREVIRLLTSRVIDGCQHQPL